MKILSEKMLKGKRVITIEVADNEHLMAIQTDAYYSLGGQVNDIMGSDVLIESTRVYWDSIGQKWEQA